MRKSLSILISLSFMLLTLCSCSSAPSGSSTPESEAEATAAFKPISIYYVTTPYYNYIEEKLELAKDELDLDDALLSISTFETYEELAAAIDQTGMPDLLLLDHYYNAAGTPLDIWQLAEDGELADLGTLLEADSTYQEENYVDGVMQAGRIGDVQYFLPFSMQNSFSLLTTPKYEASELANLPEEYDLNQLLLALQHESEREDARKYVISTGMGYYLPYSAGDMLYQFLTETGFLRDVTASGAAVQEEDLPLALQHVYRIYSDTQNLMSDASLDNMNFAQVNDVFLAQLSTANMLSATYWYMNLYQHILDQQLVLQPYPYAQSSGEYGVVVDGLALIGAQSEAPESAYRLARAIMDLPASAWTNNVIATQSPMQWSTSIHRETLTTQIEFLTTYTTSSGYGDERFTSTGLTDELASQLTAWVDQIHYAEPMNPFLTQKLEDCFTPFLTGESSDLDQALASFVGSLS